MSKYPNLAREQRQLMLRQLLTDRYKVVVHHQAKMFPLYALVLAKGGPKFKETNPEDLRKSPVFGVMCTNTQARRGSIEMHGCTMKQFANNLSGLGRFDLGRKVVDRTGLTGYYTLELDWGPVNAIVPPGAGLTAPAPSGPSIFTAVKEQLGLELKPDKGPLDTIVIDRAEMPTPN